jgi:hypothetical protein
LLARFTTTANHGAEAVRLIESEHTHYAVNWHTGQFPLSNDRLYRIRVIGDGVELGHVDVLVGDRGNVQKSSSSVAVVRGSTLPIRFRIVAPVVKDYRLKVLLGPGVLGSPATSDSYRTPGERIGYSFDLAPGYENLRVLFDGEYVQPSGTITMDRAHLLSATADVTVALPPGGDMLLESAKEILTSGQPVEAYQKYLDQATDLVEQVGEVEAARRLAIISYVAYDPVRDAEALVRVDAALAGHTFVVQRGSNSLGGLRLGRRSAAAANAANATVYYVNGILNDFASARVSTAVLERIVHEANLPSAPEVRLLYNRTYSAQMTPLQVRTTLCLQDLARAEPFIGDLSMDFRYLRCLGDYAQYFATNFDLTESIRQVLQLTGATSYVSEADAQAFSRTLRRDVDWGRKVVLVPHSQGNLMSQQTLHLLTSELGSGGSKLPCLGVVSLAAPLSENWSVADTALIGIAVKGDIILTLGMNHFPRIETALSRQADREIAELESLSSVVGVGATIVAKLRRIRWGLRLHAAVDSYMQSSETRGRIRTGIGDLAQRDCAGGVYYGLWEPNTGFMGVGGPFKVVLEELGNGVSYGYYEWQGVAGSNESAYVLKHAGQANSSNGVVQLTFVYTGQLVFGEIVLNNVDLTLGTFSNQFIGTRCRGTRVATVLADPPRYASFLADERHCYLEG